MNDRDGQVQTSSDGTRWLPEVRACPVCRATAARTLGARGGRAHRDRKGAETKVVRCSSCGLLYANPTLVPQSNPYDIHGADEYFSLHDSSQKTRRGDELAAFAERLLGGKGTLLELGCGRGELLIGAANRGWDVHGVEMTEPYARDARARGIDVECRAIEECKALDHTYDVVLLPAILEHLYDPMDCLRRVRAALRPGGLVFIEVPNEMSLAMRAANLYMRLRGRDWAINLSPTFPPFHVVGFSPTSLRTAIERAGLSVRVIDVVRYDNVVPATATWLDRLERAGWCRVQALGARLGMGDGILCWAERRS